MSYGYDNNLYGVEPAKRPVKANFLSVGLPTTVVLAFRGWLIFDVMASPRYEYFFDIPTERAFNISFYFGGTSLLIVVGVALDTVSQIETHLITRHYEGFMKGVRIKGRRG